MPRLDSVGWLYVEMTPSPVLGATVPLLVMYSGDAYVPAPVVVPSTTVELTSVVICDPTGILSPSIARGTSSGRTRAFFLFCPNDCR